MSEIQRYDFDKAWGIERNDQGIYVEYDDHAAIVAQLETELAEARKFERVLNDIQSLLTDDKFSAMFQSLGQYRKTIFETIDAAIKDQQ